MNPRIQEKDLAFYQKEPDVSSPKCVSFPLKSLEANKNLEESISNDTLNNIPSMGIMAKKLNSMNSKPNLSQFQPKTRK